MQKEFVVLGGIKYRVVIKHDDNWILALPYGNIEYILWVDPNKSSKEAGKFKGLPITKGLKLDRNA